MTGQDGCGAAADEQAGQWSHPSVLAFSGGQDPMVAAASTARHLLELAIQYGLVAPPVDPFDLAKLLGLHLQPSNDVQDAEIYAVDLPTGGSIGLDRDVEAPLADQVRSPVPLALAYNPSRPRGRLRFSLAHEIAHALFPDVHQSVRRRTYTGAVPPAQASVPSLHASIAGSGGDVAADGGWELELICNVIAAELLVPKAAVEGFADTDLDIDFLMEIRRRWDVSTETLLRRIVAGSERDVFLVAVSRRRGPQGLRVDYVLGSPSTNDRPTPIGRGDTLPIQTVVGECTAVGQTARGTIALAAGVYDAQAVGVPGKA